jgi:hypothetical protein
MDSENENEYEYDENTESNINESLENASNHSVSSHDSDSEVEFKSWRECLLEEDMIDIENSVFEMIDEYLQNEISTMSSPQFHANMKREITFLLYESLYDVHFSEQSSRYRADMSTSMIEICKNEDLEEVEQLVSEICDSFFENQIDIPPRSYTSTFDIPVSSEEKQTIMSTIDKLRTTFQPKQLPPVTYGRYLAQIVNTTVLFMKSVIHIRPRHSDKTTSIPHRPCTGGTNTSPSVY